MNEEVNYDYENESNDSNFDSVDSNACIQDVPNKEKSKLFVT